MTTAQQCPICGNKLRKINSRFLGWINFSGALVSALFTLWISKLYFIGVVFELCLTFYYFCKQEEEYTCAHCMRRYKKSEVYPKDRHDCAE